MLGEVLVTGADGFVGSRLVDVLAGHGRKVRAAVRQARTGDQLALGDICPGTDWSQALSGASVVVHLAARVHVMHESSQDALSAFRRINVESTANLAKQAAESGARRFVFLSSIKVNGEKTSPGIPFSPDMHPSPSDAYARSKYEAEKVLQEVGAKTGMEIVIIRPPLVYGPGVKANFLAMMRWLEKGVPMPLGGIDNQRSFLGLDNLADLIAICVEHPAAGDQTFLAADGEDLSTPELLRRLGKALGKPARLVPLPTWMLVMGATLLGRKAVAERLCGSLQVDTSKTRDVLGWTPPVSVDEGLDSTAKWFLKNS